MKLEGIIDFLVLGEYIGLPVRTYSFGMVMRLDFAIASSVESDLLLMNNRLAWGSRFIKKAEDPLKALVNNTPILVIPSQSQEILNEVCNRVLHLEGGKFFDQHTRFSHYVEK